MLQRNKNLKICFWSPSGINDTIGLHLIIIVLKLFFQNCEITYITNKKRSRKEIGARIPGIDKVLVGRDVYNYNEFNKIHSNEYDLIISHYYELIYKGVKYFIHIIFWNIAIKPLKKWKKYLIHYLIILYKCFKYNLASLLNINSYPRFLVFYTTFRCNSRCKACNIWKGDDKLKQAKELTIEQIDNIFSDPLFRKLQYINIQGGEATLRDDLAEVTKTIINRIPSLKRIGLTSNGLNTDVVALKTKQLYKLCNEHGIDFVICFSIDGVNEYHDFARGKDAFKRVLKSIEAVNEMRGKPKFGLGTNCVLTAHNIYNIDEIIKFQKKTFNMMIPNLTVVEFREHFLNKKGSQESKELLFTENPKEKELMISYLNQNNTPRSFSDFMSYRYEQLRAMLEENKPRTQSCQYKISGLVLDYKGGLMICPIGGHLGSCLERKPSEIFFSIKSKFLRKKLIKTKCKACYPYNFYSNEQEKDFLKYLTFFLKTRFKKQ